MPLTDGECIRLCLDGHPEAYDQLVARYEAPLLAYLVGRLKDPELAEEAAHEAFVRSYLALGRLQKREAFFSWLVGVASHVARDELRLRSRQRGLDESAPAPPAEPALERYDLERAVAALSQPYREVVLMRFFGGMPCTAIAERLGLSVGTVTMRLSRAYLMLRECLEGPGGDVSDKEVRG